MSDSILVTAFDLERLGYTREVIRQAFNATDKRYRLSVLGWDHKLPLFGRAQAVRTLDRWSTVVRGG
jgi:hypothetical protein